jgi:hypothetical protein
MRQIFFFFLKFYYNIFQDINNVQLEYEPLRCRQSGCILNPYCPIDYR